MIIKEVKFGTDEYKSMLDFRFSNLRKPLGLNWSYEDLEEEEKQIHFALIINKQIHGSCLLKLIDNQNARIRQMAISHEFQKKGYGRKLIKHVEKYALTHNIFNIRIIARLSVTDFYLKQGYIVKGEKFTDVTVDSIKMTKKLNNV